jgi:hypothetical protein
VAREQGQDQALAGRMRKHLAAATSRSASQAVLVQRITRPMYDRRERRRLTVRSADRPMRRGVAVDIWQMQRTCSTM